MYQSSEDDLLTQIEAAIVTRLDPLADMGLDILNSPKSNRVKRRAQALVFFSGSSDEKPGADGKLARSQLSFTINLQIEDLRSHQPAYPFLMEIRRQMQGWNPNIGRQAGRFWITGIDYQPYTEEEKLLWVYNLTFALQILH